MVNENDLGMSHDMHLQPPRQKRMRTSFKHHQLRIMKSYFALNHNPDAKDLKQLAQKTGLNKRVLQVRVIGGPDVNSMFVLSLRDGSPWQWHLWLERHEPRNHPAETKTYANFLQAPPIACNEDVLCFESQPRRQGFEGIGPENGPLQTSSSGV